eukprot:CAMPEP_0185598446 /NCGR_PEP_ID=MMETSP0434-20130131/82000_1 /TAXON_ID=626734 ORGANISM="Favella taraikaensis, Strain Fe Narragansett Bay" /NCGR_SAMPLE_ID=MMETSP0434 /ASSEMBLY_ACC=CAM_ASM_000379 /LENGTH=61 /DNA_ID=CAMNT_0028227429 /DNA_START=890 /DNA_END=1078 /DNA_ORIENTATION=-
MLSSGANGRHLLAADLARDQPDAGWLQCPRSATSTACTSLYRSRNSSSSRASSNCSIRSRA